jgi:hypothetical protein
MASGETNKQTAKFGHFQASLVLWEFVLLLLSSNSAESKFCGLMGSRRDGFRCTLFVPRASTTCIPWLFRQRRASLSLSVRGTPILCLKLRCFCLLGAVDLKLGWQRRATGGRWRVTAGGDGVQGRLGVRELPPRPRRLSSSLGNLLEWPTGREAREFGIWQRTF